MTYYIDPPTGNISLQKLETFSRKRLSLLFMIYDSNGDQSKISEMIFDAKNAIDSDCLIEGTTKDNISHFILRLAMCSGVDTKGFFLDAETRLFDFRLLSMSETELYDFLRRSERKLLKSRRDYFDLQVLSEISTTLQMIKGQNKCWKQVARNYKHFDECARMFQVPFYLIPDLVGQRTVAIHKGIADVPYRYLSIVLSALFRRILVWGLNRASQLSERTLQDERMRRVSKKIQLMFRQNYKGFTKYRHEADQLSHDNVQEVLSLFPPCMSHLHHVLQQRHRLHHHSRIQYTLFLKEIGMPVHEALQFWRKEYSVPVDNKDGCHHDWQGCGRRYTYNIRHLYGLEGSRTNYRGHCCCSLQRSTPGPGESGGCPFKHFDERHLQAFLTHEGICYPREIISLTKVGEYTKACERFLERKIEKAHHKHEESEGESSHCGDIGETKQTVTCVKRKHSVQGYVDMSGQHRSKTPRLCLSSYTDHSPGQSEPTGQGHNSRSGIQSVDHEGQTGSRSCNYKSNNFKDFKRPYVLMAEDQRNGNNMHDKCLTIKHDVTLDKRNEDDSSDDMDVKINSLCAFLDDDEIDKRNEEISDEGDESDDESVYSGNTSNQNVQKINRNEDSGIACFEHEVCLSQMTSKQPEQNAHDEGDKTIVSRTCVPEIRKPADYYFSFKRLVQGLQNQT